MLNRRAVLRGVGSTTAAAIMSGALAAPLQKASAAGNAGAAAIIGSVSIGGRLVQYGEFICRYVWGDDFTVECAVVIMDGEIQIQHLASYASSWSGNFDRRRTGLVQVGRKEWVRVPVLGRVVDQSHAVTA